MSKSNHSHPLEALHCLLQIQSTMRHAESCLRALNYPSQYWCFPSVPYWNAQSIKMGWQPCLLLPLEYNKQFTCFRTPWCHLYYVIAILQLFIADQIYHFMGTGNVSTLLAVLHIRFCLSPRNLPLSDGKNITNILSNAHKKSFLTTSSNAFNLKLDQ